MAAIPPSELLVDGDETEGAFDDDTFIFPVSFAQQRLWFLDQLEPGSALYNIPAAIRLRGSLDVAILERAVNEIVRRHEALRTTIVALDGEPIQAIDPSLALPLPTTDLADLPAAERDAAARQVAVEAARRPFDLAGGPLVRTSLLRLGQDDHILLLTMHHAVADGWSMGVLFGELAVLYPAFLAGEPSPLADLPVQYADFAAWQREWLQGPVLEEQLAYWRRQLSGASTVLDLPTDRPRPARQTYRGALYAFDLPAALGDAVKTVCQREGVSLFMALLAAFQALLQRYTGQDDLVIGAPIAGRTRAEVEPLIGFFANTLALRGDLAGDPTFRELLGRVREVTLGAYAHQDLPFERLVEVLQPERDLSRHPIFQVMLAIQPSLALELEGLAASPVIVESGTAKFDLTLFVEEAPGGLRGQIEYSTDLFDGATIARLAEHFRTLLAGAVAEPDRRLSELPLLGDADRAQLAAWGSEPALGAGRCVHELVAAQADLTPHATAIVGTGERLSYRELNERANRLAHHLRTLGVGPEVPVGVCLERSPDLVVGLLAVLKAGGAYLPLDPSYPPDRLAYMLADAAAPVLLAEQVILDRLPHTSARVVCVDGAEATAVAALPAGPPITDVGPSNLAYVIYTSGSTGRPKGVEIEHRAATAFLSWASAAFRPDELAGVLAATSICFDLSVFELFAPLTVGGAAILADNILALPSLAAASEVTLINTVPSVLAELLDSGAVLPPSVRTVNLAGEPLPNDLAQGVYGLAGVERVVNLYGPTEDTTYSTWALVERGAAEPPSIGRPIAGSGAYLLDRRLRAVPIGAVGELYLDGVGLARGYRGRPELSAERFVPHPFATESPGRLYRTGDLARWRADGRLEYLGRADRQVKVRGFRIEPGEVELALREHPAVADAAVAARDDAPGGRALVAYVVPANGSPPTPGELRGFLRERLPEHLVPTAYVSLYTFPRTPNGKLDRGMLPAPNAGQAGLEDGYLAPRTDTEARLAAAWSEVLGVERIGVTDNFFDLGGHSLLATRLVARVRDAFGVELPLREIFSSPTVETLAASVETALVATSSATELDELLALVESMDDGEAVRG